MDGDYIHKPLEIQNPKLMPINFGLGVGFLPLFRLNTRPHNPSSGHLSVPQGTLQSLLHACANCTEVCFICDVYGCQDIRVLVQGCNHPAHFKQPHNSWNKSLVYIYRIPIIAAMNAIAHLSFFIYKARNKSHPTVLTLY